MAPCLDCSRLNNTQSQHVKWLHEVTSEPAARFCLDKEAILSQYQCGVASCNVLRALEWQTEVF